jgi:putative membrane protein
MKTKIFLMAGLIAMALCQNVNAQEKPKEAKEQNKDKFDGTSIEGDTKWAVMVADAGMLEEKLGHLAMKNGSNAKIKELGKHMVDDHSKANAELKALAAKRNITLPTQLSDKSQKDYDALAKKTGAEFDKDYAKAMVKDHKMVIEAFEKEAEKGNDAELKAWAASKLATLKHHLQMSEEAEKAVK